MEDFNERLENLRKELDVESERTDEFGAHPNYVAFAIDENGTEIGAIIMPPSKRSNGRVHIPFKHIMESKKKRERSRNKKGRHSGVLEYHATKGERRVSDVRR